MCPDPVYRECMYIHIYMSVCMYYFTPVGLHEFKRKICLWERHIIIRLVRPRLAVYFFCVLFSQVRRWKGRRRTVRLHHADDRDGVFACRTLFISNNVFSTNSKFFVNDTTYNKVCLRLPMVLFSWKYSRPYNIITHTRKYTAHILRVYSRNAFTPKKRIWRVGNGLPASARRARHIINPKPVYVYIYVSVVESKSLRNF